MIQATELQQPIAVPLTDRDRRVSARFQISLPLSIRYYPPKRNSTAFSGDAINLSGHGIYFVTDSPFRSHTELALAITMPGKQAWPAALIARARVRVVRSEEIWHLGARRVGVGAEIEYYRV
jgi:c-di-GMP-binding flagellar brake protein YcgR